MSERHGERPTCNWGSGDLPGPYAVGDVLDVPDDCPGLFGRIDTAPGRYVVVCGFSIDEGDAWYYRVAPKVDKKRDQRVSDRLHIAFVSRSTWDHDCDYLAGSTLVSTTDPDGLAERERLIADGWRVPSADLERAAIGRLPRLAADLARAVQVELVDHLVVAPNTRAALDAVAGAVAEVQWLSIEVNE